VAERVAILLHIEPAQKEAFARWAAAEQRTLSAQARVFFQQIPSGFFQPEDE